MTACQLNFLPNITCITNLTKISLNDTRAPYYCINPITNILCSNTSECCKQGYQFNDDAQQCLCKYKKQIFHNKISKFWFCLVEPVCNETLCGINGTCQDSELQPNGYICTCSSTTDFDGTTCVRMYFV
jgi:hypothetical protein